jgi:hypothetical protein
MLEVSTEHALDAAEWVAGTYAPLSAIARE